ncbi:hypothetical protein Tco_1398858 [Tanacetum coccineum]
MVGACTSQVDYRMVEDLELCVMLVVERCRRRDFVGLLIKVCVTMGGRGVMPVVTEMINIRDRILELRNDQQYDDYDLHLEI